MVPVAQVIRNDGSDCIYRFASRTPPEIGVAVIGEWLRQVDFAATFQRLECGRRYVASIAKTVPTVIETASVELPEH